MVTSAHDTSNFYYFFFIFIYLLLFLFYLFIFIFFGGGVFGGVTLKFWSTYLHRLYISVEPMVNVTLATPM